MTEAEWLACSNLQKMLEFLRGKASDRKLRLFAIACFRRMRVLLEPDTPCWQFLEVAEQYADGLLSRKAIVQAESALGSKRHRPARAAVANAFGATNLKADSFQVARAAARSALNFAGRVPGKASSPTTRAPVREVEKAHQLQLLRDLVGNPFRSVTFSREWGAATPPLRLARQMYESRDFSAMPILADALQDAGCNHDAMLNHCRDTSLPHVRGCWVVDLVLEKE